MSENWRDILGYEGLYQISDNGKVKSLPHKTTGHNGITYPFGGIILKPQSDKFGYLRVALRKNSVAVLTSVHRLLAQHFIPNPLNKEQVNHIDGDKANNVLLNLEWATRSENKIHSYRILGEKRPKGDASKTCKIPDAQIPNLILHYNQSKSFVKTGKKFGVSGTQVWRIVKKKSRI